MMAPSVGHQQRSQSVDQTQYYLPPPEHHHINHEKNDSHCSSVSDGESYECYGEVEMDTSSPNNVNGTESGQTAVNGNNLKRNTWFRTSLRRNGKNHETLPNRRWGSFRHSSGKRLGPVSLTGGLNRSSSFNSSGRSSTCDTADDVCSDISLEEDVLDLTHKVQMLQQQMNVLADNQNHSDERYTRAKQENATLQARIHMLEEQLREVEVRAEERLSEEERRHRELVARVDREKQLQVENCAIRLQTLELENNSLKEEATRCRSQADKLRQEKESLEDRLSESDNGLSLLREEVAILREQERRHKEQQIHNQQMMEELSHEIERLRGEQKLAMDELSSREGGLSSSAHQQLQEQLASLRQENKRLQEAHDEMQALLLTRSVEEGRSLLTENKSLAAELEAMSQDEVRGALKEQQEVNAQLRAYIDGMLLNIVENYPQLLEVKPNP